MSETAEIVDQSFERPDCPVCGSDKREPVAQGIDYIYHGSERQFSMHQCTGCGHLYLSPRPTTDHLAWMYPETYASFSGRYAKNNWLNTVKNRVMVRRFERLSGVTSNNISVLDIGCGDGEFAMALHAAYPQGKFTGLDWKFSAATLSRFADLRITPIESTIEDADLPAGEYDVIVLNQLIEHLWQPGAVLKKLAAALKPGGRMLIATPNPDGYDRSLFSAGYWGGYYFPRHLNLFSVGGMAQIANDNELRVIAHHKLVAPVIWSYSLRAWVQERFPGVPWLDRTVDIRNPLILAVFTILDGVLLKCGVTTSNQAFVLCRQDQ